MLHPPGPASSNVLSVDSQSSFASDATATQGFYGSQRTSSYNGRAMGHVTCHPGSNGRLMMLALH